MSNMQIRVINDMNKQENGTHSQGKQSNRERLQDDPVLEFAD